MQIEFLAPAAKASTDGQPSAKNTAPEAVEHVFGEVLEGLDAKQAPPEVLDPDSDLTTKLPLPAFSPSNAGTNEIAVPTKRAETAIPVPVSSSILAAPQATPALVKSDFMQPKDAELEVSEEGQLPRSTVRVEPTKSGSFGTRAQGLETTVAETFAAREDRGETGSPEDLTQKSEDLSKRLSSSEIAQSGEVPRPADRLRDPNETELEQKGLPESALAEASAAWNTRAPSRDPSDGSVQAQPQDKLVPSPNSVSAERPIDAPTKDLQLPVAAPKSADTPSPRVETKAPVDPRIPAVTLAEPRTKLAGAAPLEPSSAPIIQSDETVRSAAAPERVDLSGEPAPRVSSGQSVEAIPAKPVMPVVAQAAGAGPAPQEDARSITSDMQAPQAEPRMEQVLPARGLASTSPPTTPLTEGTALAKAIDGAVVSGEELKPIGPQLSDPQAPRTPVISGPTPAPAPQAPNVQAAPIPNQIAMAVHASDSAETEIRLDPKELGSVRIVLSARDAGVNVTIHAERAETLDLMRKHADDLSASFQDLGFGETAFSFSQGERSEDQSSDPESRSNGYGANAEQGSQSRQIVTVQTDGMDIRL